MTLEEAAQIVYGPEFDAAGWEQQQDCEAHQQYEQSLEALTDRIDGHLDGIHDALRELKRLQAF